jgi:hypothetical protein
VEWEVEFSDDFERWWDSLSEAEQRSVRASVLLLRECAPSLGRPRPWRWRVLACLKYISVIYATQCQRSATLLTHVSAWPPKPTSRKGSEKWGTRHPAIGVIRSPELVSQIGHISPYRLPSGPSYDTPRQCHWSEVPSSHLEGVIPKAGVFQPVEGSCVGHPTFAAREIPHYA